MAKNTTEEAKSVKKSGGSGIDSVKKELGPMGYIGIIIGAVIIIGASVYFMLEQNKQKKNLTAQDELFQAQYYFEQDSLDLAMNGDGRNLGFLDIIDIYGGTNAANLANFYAGTIYLKQGNYQEALNFLGDFSTPEVLAQSRAEELIGDAYMELGQFSDAARQYEKAASVVDDKFFSPGYLLKAALAHENNNDNQSALEAVTKIVDDYYGASQYNEARKQKARLEALTSR
jgi:tetratricopeptide (TPR) repeat protein